MFFAFKGTRPCAWNDGTTSADAAVYERETKPKSGFSWESRNSSSFDIKIRLCRYFRDEKRTRCMFYPNFKTSFIIYINGLFSTDSRKIAFLHVGTACYYM